MPGTAGADLVPELLHVGNDRIPDSVSHLIIDIEQGVGTQCCLNCRVITVLVEHPGSARPQLPVGHATGVTAVTSSMSKPRPDPENARASANMLVGAPAKMASSTGECIIFISNISLT